MLMRRLINSPDKFPWLACFKKIKFLVLFNTSWEIFFFFLKDKKESLVTAILATLASFNFTSPGNLLFTTWEEVSASWLSVAAGGLAAIIWTSFLLKWYLNCHACREQVLKQLKLTFGDQLLQFPEGFLKCRGFRFDVRTAFLLNTERGVIARL